jgi:hypothetical protein
VAAEVRIFPLPALGGEPSPFVPMCMRELRAAGHDVSIEKVPYEFRRGFDEMMRIRMQMSPCSRGSVERTVSAARSRNGPAEVGR